MTPLIDEPSLEDEKTARAHMLLSTLAIGLMGLALFLGHELTRPPGGQATRVCTAETEAEACEPDESCVDGLCTLSSERGPPPRCQENDPCGECECEGKFACVEGRCRPLEDDVCSDEVMKVLRDTMQFEREQCRATNGKAAQCEAKDLDKFFMDHRDYNTVLNRLKHGATIHFNNGEPGEYGLSPEHEAAYTQSLAAIKERLLGAKHILVIGRASNDRSNQQSHNYSLAQMRLIAVQKWLIELSETPQGQDAVEKKLITLAIGTSSPLDPELLLGRELHRYITWSDESTHALRTAVKGHAKLKGAARAALSRRINQSVLVIPIPCEIPDEPQSAAAQP